ncbi:hypothetical protein AAFC00_000156 [Neodothiora populina]|uniref:NAD(P)-binding protein n=1 Tax=Neodothiora populina TaxID=2781224 RepID=A0ABR3P1U1_9PEZI
MADQFKYTNKLADKHVLIIGGSSGIGYGVAEGALEHGARVTISSSNPQRCSDAVEKLKKAYPSAVDRVVGYAASMGDEQTLEANIEKLFEQTGKVDHVVYTAGDSLAMIPIKEVTLGPLKQAGMVRYFAPILVAKVAIKYMESSTASSITFTTGSVSEKPLDGWSVVNGYATALQGTTRGLALDLKPIRVNLVSPGVINTALFGITDEAKKEEMFKPWVAKMATGAVGQVEDVAEAYLYAMKDKNLTGSMISSNGGALIM